MMLTLMANDKKLDIMIKREQKIRDVYCSLLENGYLPPACEEREMQVYSMRRRAYINPVQTFGQAGIYNGDILRIE